tara:strand:+ start:231 stop:587 length:357 start_codon:yes stop_codon:yes gene_type:complete
MNISFGSKKITGDLDKDYDGIVWDEDSLPEQKPTKEQVRAKMIELQSGLPMKHLRAHRQYIMKDTDIYSLPDYPHKNETIKQAWLDYRQALRDLPKNASPKLDENGILSNVTWPTRPS